MDTSTTGSINAERDLATLWETFLAYPERITEGQTLVVEWFRLQRTWPSDGWIGAADARAEHNRKVREHEAKMREFHERIGTHGPELRLGPFGGRPTAKCICGADMSIGGDS